jgi:putative membrane protein
MGVLWRQNVWTLWHPEVLVLVGALGVVYSQLVGPLARGWGIADPPERFRRVAAVVTLVLLYVALGTPLKLLATSYLFTAHVVQELLESLVIAPLALIALPPWVWTRLAQSPGLKTVGRWLTHPVVALLLYNAVMFGWEYPALLDASLRDNGLYLLEQVIQMITAGLFWWPILVRWRDVYPMKPGHQMLYLFFAMDLMMPTWIYVGITTRPYYQVYITAPRVLGWSPLGDQVTAGYLMLGAMLVVYAVMFGRALFRYERLQHIDQWYE